MGDIRIDPKPFAAAYARAVAAGRESFIFSGHEWLTDYAGYVLEYVRNVCPDSLPGSGSANVRGRARRSQVGG
jgi:hypothetical protein